MLKKERSRTCKEAAMRGFHLCLTILLGFAATSYAQDDANGDEYMQGTEKAVFQEKAGRNQCRVFSKYLIRTTDAEEDVGQLIGVYGRDPGSPQQLCKVRGKRLLLVQNDDANYFDGLFGKFMFVDSGTSAGNRGIEIFDLTTGKSILSTGYYYPGVKLVEGRYLVYDYPSDKTGDIKTCKEAAKWQKEGGGIQWVISKKFDLQTRKTISVGGLKCAYAE